MSVSVNRHLRAAAAVLALLGMLVLSTGVALIVAAPANASSAEHKGGDCGGDDVHKSVAKHEGDDGGDCGGGCWNDDDKNLGKRQGDCGGGCDEKQVPRTSVSSHQDDDCNPCPPVLSKHKGGDWNDCDPCPPILSKHKGDGDWNECQNPCDVIIIGKKSTQIPVQECIAPDPEVTFTDPSCANESTASWNGTGDHSTFALADGDVVGPDETVTVIAHTVFPYEYSDHSTSIGFEHTFGSAVTPEDCAPPTVAVPTDPSFTDPTCTTDGSVFVPNDPPSGKKATGPVILTSDAEGVHYVVSGSLKAGETAYVDATALPGYVIEEGAPVHWEHTFAVPADCPVVEPPVVEPPTVVAPTVVHAGLVGTTLPSVDPRTAQGRILVALGLALLVLAGGLGLRPSIANRR